MSSLPASIKRNGWKIAKKKWRHRFSNHNPICYHGNQWMNLAEFQTHPRSHVCYHYLWVWKGFNQEQRRKGGDIVFPNYKPMGIFADVQGQLTLQSVVQAGRNSNSSKLLCMSSLPASMKRFGWKTGEKKWRHRFLHCNPMGAFCCHGNQSSDPIWPKTKCSLSPNSMMLQIKFGCDQPIGFRDIHVWKCEHTDGQTDGRTHARTPARLVYYKLTSEPSAQVEGSGELKRRFRKRFC